MVADRAEHVTAVIEPALAAGRWVVSDRYAGSTIAYQGYGRGLDPAWLGALVEWAAGGVAADLSVLVDVPVEVAASRLALGAGGVGPDRLELLGTGFAARVRDGFLTQAFHDPTHWIVVDGEEEAVALTEHIVTSIRARLGDPPGAGSRR
jgi:dTMP kinase